MLLREDSLTVVQLPIRPNEGSLPGTFLTTAGVSWHSIRALGIRLAARESSLAAILVAALRRPAGLVVRYTLAAFEVVGTVRFAISQAESAIAAVLEVATYIVKPCFLSVRLHGSPRTCPRKPSHSCCWLGSRLWGPMKCQLRNFARRWPRGTDLATLGLGAKRCN
jgi:hypothetical protein